jgi:flagellar hook-associated protein 1 FlgK
MTKLLGIATSALQFTQQALDTTSHNIANVNTQGYSRQRVDATTREPSFQGFGFLGNGVKTAAVRRSYDQFLEAQLRDSTASFSELDALVRLSSQIDDLIADPNTGLAASLADFFNAVHDAASDPTSIPARQTLLSEARSLTDRFKGLDARLSEMTHQVFQDLGNLTHEVNAIAGKIAELNQRIIAAGQASPNDLLDQRDQLIAQLAEKVRVTQVQHANGAVSVFIGTGQALVQDVRANALLVKPNALNPERPEIVLATPTGELTITRQIQGGELKGSLRFVDEALMPTRAKLGRIAAGLAVEFNALHRSGFDLTGNTGQEFFTPFPIPISQTGSGAIAVDYANVADLAASDYRLDYDGSVYTLTRLSDGVTNTLTSFPTVIDGLHIDLTTPPSGPTSFLIRPTAVSSALELALTDPRQIALAATDTSGGAIGDNGVGLELAALESKKLLLGGKATLHDAYSQMAAEVGTLTHAAKIAHAAQDALKQQAIKAREAVSGVNLDEEAANLVKFQQSYQAAAHVVTVAQQTFEALINAIRR